MDIAKERDYYFDNVKFLLILLVVIGHTIEPLIKADLNLKAIYIFIYTFHMPLFILISGYFSKNIGADKYFIKNVRKILVPYIIFQILYFFFFRFGMNNIQTKFSLLTPYWIMWFMFSMFIWKSILPYFVKIKYPLLVSVIIAVIAGYIPQIGYFLSLSRTITFFPFFLLGYYLKKPDIEKLNTLNKKIISIIILVCGLIVIYYFSQSIYYGWLYGCTSYASLKASQWYAGLYRLGIFLAAAIFSFAVLTLVPRKKTVFSEMGMRTIYLYLLHGFVVKLFVKYDLYSSLDIKVLIFAAILISVILSSKFVERITKPLVQP
ncbi:MAG: acyltransferase family protein [Deltaproteobacteria bacterium]